MSSRANKSGFAKEAKDKVDAKYDSAQAAEVLGWIKSYVSDPDFSTDGSMDNFHETLKDGYVLKLFLNELNKRKKPEACKNVKRGKMAFQQMDEIGQFLNGIGAAPYCVEPSEQFQTVDLYERQNLASVVTCLSALARKCMGLGLGGFGPKEAEANKRDFSEEQLKAGQNVIGLQMGTNKGASQAGQNFGKSRGIND